MAVVAAAHGHGACLLGPDDLERVVAIDRAHSGHDRRHFFEKRFAAAKAHPADYIHVGVMRGGSLRGFAIARILRGEFGQERAIAVLDAVGVEAHSQERGIGHALMDEVLAIARDMGVQSVQSLADWTNHELVRFFHASSFELAPRLVLERAVPDQLDERSEDV